MGLCIRVAATCCLLSASLMICREVAAAEAVEPFNGKDLTGWKIIPKRGRTEGKWTTGTAALNKNNSAEIEALSGGADLVNTDRSLNIRTEKEFGDCRLEIEVMVPKGGNSGIYLLGNYEIQVLDSFGKDSPGKGDMGAIYDKTVPKVNASKAPGEWQKFVIVFRAPRFDAVGKKIANAKLVRCTLNGQVIHENLEIDGLTGGALSKTEVPTGPLMLQGDHAPVAYRNIKIEPM